MKALITGITGQDGSYLAEMPMSAMLRDILAEATRTFRT